MKINEKICRRLSKKTPTIMRKSKKKLNKITHTHKHTHTKTHFEFRR